MRQFPSILCLVLALPVAVASAGVWNDYIQPIGSGYTIVVSGGVFLQHDGKTVIPDEDKPLVAYAITPTRLFTKHEDWGGKSTAFYVVQTPTDAVVGPLTPSAFAANAEVAKAGPLNWAVPTNPNPEFARDGMRMYYGAIAVAVAGPTVLLAVGVAVIVLWVRRRTRRSNA